MGISFYIDNSITKIVLSIKNVDDTAYDVGGCSCVLYIKKKTGQPDSAALISLSGSIYGNANLGKFLFSLTKTQREAGKLVATTYYVCDFQLTTSAGKIYCVRRDQLYLNEE